MQRLPLSWVKPRWAVVAIVSTYSRSTSEAAQISERGSSITAHLPTHIKDPSSPDYLAVWLHKRAGVAEAWWCDWLRGTKDSCTQVCIWLAGRGFIFHVLQQRWKSPRAITRPRVAKWILKNKINKKTCQVFKNGNLKVTSIQLEDKLVTWPLIPQKDSENSKPLTPERHRG